MSDNIATHGGSRKGSPFQMTSEVSNASASHAAEPVSAGNRKAELRSFLFLTVVMAPVLSVMIVGGYGFLVWMYQLVNGPPGH